MGTIKSGILGGFSGKVGAVIGTSWKGISVMRSQAQSVANPRTTGQVENRDRFKSVFTFATSILAGVIKPLNDRFAQGMSGYNLFCSRNKNIFLSNGTFAPLAVVLSLGKLGVTPLLDEVVESGLNEDFLWNPAISGAYQAASDKAYLVVCDADGVVIGQSAGVVLRSVGTIGVDFSREIIGGETISAHLAFLRADGSIAGETSNRTFVVTE